MSRKRCTLCGIAGVRRFGPEPIHAEQIRILLAGNERRGNQATGVGIQQIDGSIQVYKDDEPASKVIGDHRFDTFLNENLREDTICCILHTRAATKGSPIYPKNNHPMWDEVTAVVHNGVINNDDFLFGEMKLKRVAETDSDIFRAIFAENGLTPKGINLCNRVSGSAAIAVIDTRFPGKLLLARSGNPIELATTENHLIWSSERQPIYNSLRPFYKRFGIWQRRMRADAGFMPMANDTAWIISDQPHQTEDGPDWIEWHQKFSVANYFSAREYKVNDTYNMHRNRLYGGGKALVIVCKGCKTMLPITPEQRNNLERLICKKCKTPCVEKEKQA